MNARKTRRRGKIDYADLLFPVTSTHIPSTRNKNEVCTHFETENPVKNYSYKNIHNYVYIKPKYI